MQTMTQGVINPVLADQLLTIGDLANFHRGLSATAQPARAEYRAAAPVLVRAERDPAIYDDARPSISLRLKHALTGVGVNLLEGATTVMSALNTTLNPISREPQVPVTGITPLLIDDLDTVAFDREFFSDLVAEFHDRKYLPAKEARDTTCVTAMYQQHAAGTLELVSRMRSVLQSENRISDTPDGDVSERVLLLSGYEDGGERSLERIGLMLRDHRDAFDKLLVENGYYVTMVPGETIKLFLTRKQWVVIPSM